MSLIKGYEILNRIIITRVIQFVCSPLQNYRRCFNIENIAISSSIRSRFLISTSEKTREDEMSKSTDQEKERNTISKFQKIVADRREATKRQAAKQEKKLKCQWSVQIGPTSYMINYRDKQVYYQVLAQDFPDGQQIAYGTDPSNEIKLESTSNGNTVHFLIDEQAAQICSNGSEHQLTIGGTLVP